MPRQPTIRVNQGYRIDSKWEALALAARGLRRLTRLAWRYRTELGLLLAVLTVRNLIGRHLPGVASDDRRVYCPACRTAYGFPAPVLADFRPGAQLPLFPEVRSA